MVPLCCRLPFLFCRDTQSSLRGDATIQASGSQDLQALHRRQVCAERERAGGAGRRWTRSHRQLFARLAKDFRDAVTAARAALGGWGKQSAYLRGQILYRAAEMLEMRRGELTAELERMNGSRRGDAEAERPWRLTG
jgi:hypothetical protein